MSNARWCDWNNHAFSDKVGFIMMGQQKPASGPYNQPAVTDINEMCNECAAELGLIEDYVAPPSPGERRQAMLSAGIASIDKTKVE